MKGHVSRSNLNSPHKQKAPVIAYWQSIMGNRLHRTQECARFYFSTRYIRLGMTNTSTTLYCICLVTVLSMLKRLQSGIAVFVFEQSDFIFLCVSAIHARRTICKDYVMNCLSILYKTSLLKTFFSIKSICFYTKKKIGMYLILWDTVTCRSCCWKGFCPVSSVLDTHHKIPFICR